MQRHDDNLASRINGNGLQALAGVSVTVTDDATGLPASLYSDDGVTPISTAIITDENGAYGFYAPNGEYTIHFASVRITPFTRKLIMADPSDNPYATLAQVAAPSFASMAGYLPSGAGAQATDIQTVLREQISVFRFMTPQQIADVKARTMTLDVTAAVNAAITEQVARGGVLYVPAGTYKITPATATTDESGAILVALALANKLDILAERGAIFKFADNVSTDAAPKSMRMFATNQFLPDGFRIRGLTLDGNGQNNKISPNRATFAFNRFTQALISLSGTPGGIGAGANSVEIEGCSFLNSAGVSCIVMAQSNTPGITLGSGWKLLRNRFYNNGLDVDDHSSVFGWATDVLVDGNTFDNPAMFSDATKTGGLVAYEIHGSRTTFTRNRIRNYGQGLWIGANATEAIVNDYKIMGNTGSVGAVFFDTYSANLSSGATSESKIGAGIISHNFVEITAAPVADTVKAFGKIGARQQPEGMIISHNICRSLETVKNTVLVLMIVSPNQLVKADQITISNNKASGLVAGLVTFFGGNGATALSQNVGRVTYASNDLGTLVASPGGLYANADIVLYGGATAGRVEALRLYGLQAPSAVSVDSPSGGRATVYGKALLPIAVTWNGVTALGNGTTRSRISIDTDAGFAAMSLQLNCGSTTMFSGASIYPSFTGLVPDENAAMCGLINYPSSTAVLACRVDATGPYISTYSSAGQVTNASPAAFVSGSGMTIGGNFPIAFASI